MLDLMERAARSRKGGLFTTTLVDGFPAIQQFKEEVILGMDCWTSPRGRWRLMRRDAAIETPWGYETPGGLARLYLSVKFPDRRVRTRKAQWQYFVAGRRSAPLYAQPGSLVDAVYVDLKAAYWSICRAVGWDCDVMPGQWFSQGQDVGDFPYAYHKVARISVVQAGIAAPVPVWTGERVELRKLSNPHVNYVLWGVVQDVLHAIAGDMVAMADARYVHTDGYIVPAAYVEQAFAVLARYGLRGSIRHTGEARIKSIGAYRVGDHQTRRYDGASISAINSLAARYSEWYSARLRTATTLRHIYE
jgi:hypothetical protein